VETLAMIEISRQEKKFELFKHYLTNTLFCKMMGQLKKIQPVGVKNLLGPISIPAK
jgi:hypothetical protein